MSKEMREWRLGAINRTTYWLAFSLLLAGITLTACSIVNTPLSRTGDELLDAPQTQAANTNDWNATAFFATTCATCHGPTGAGSQVAPPLNTEDIRTADPEWIIETISNGRPGTAMPAWSVEFGGPLTSDQIEEMAVLVQSGNWDTVAAAAAEQPSSSMMGPGMMNGGMMGGGMMMGRGRQP